eukprot:gene8363-11316_t
MNDNGVFSALSVSRHTSSNHNDERQGQGGFRHNKGGRRHENNGNYDSNKKSRHYVPQENGFRIAIDNTRGRGRGRGGRDGRGAGTKRMPANMVERKEVATSPAVNLIKQLVTKVGDYSSMSEDDVLTDNISSLATMLASVGDLQEYSEELSELFVRCFLQLSVQTPIIATLIALINVKEGGHSFVELVFNKLISKLSNTLSEDEILESKLILKSLACLAHCGSIRIEGEGGLISILLSLFHRVQSNVQTIESNLINLAPGEKISLYLLANTLIWSPLEKITQSEEGNLFLDKIIIFLQEFTTSYVSSYNVNGIQSVFITNIESNSSDDAAPQLCDLTGNNRNGGISDSLWESSMIALLAIQEIKSGEIQSVTPACMISPWIALKSELEPTAANDQISSDTKMTDGNNEDKVADENDEDATLAVVLSVDPLFLQNDAIESLQEALKKIGTKSKFCHPNGSPLGYQSSSAWLRLRFSIFDAESSPEAAQCCTLSTIAKFVAVGYFVDILHFFDPIINDDGTKIGSIDLLSNHLTAVSKLFPEDSHVEYILIEILLQTIVQMPVNTMNSSSIYRITLELCKKYPTVFPPPLGVGVNTIFQMVPELTAGSYREFAKWFAFQLINTKLSWPYWDFWISEFNEAAEGAPIKLFCEIIVDKCSRNSIPDRVREALPSEFNQYIVIDEQPICSNFSEENSMEISNEKDEIINTNDGNNTTVNLRAALLEASSVLKKMLAERVDASDLEDWLENVVPIAFEEYLGIHFRGQLLLQGIIHISGTTLSKIQGLLDQYGEVIRIFASSIDSQKALLVTLFECFSLNPGILEFAFDEMLRRSQISVEAAVECLTTSKLPAGILCNNERYLVWKYAFLESVIDRSIDFVKAAVMQRMKYVDTSMLLDESLDLTPSDHVAIVSKDTNDNVAMVTNVGGIDDTIITQANELEMGNDDRAGDNEEENNRRNRLIPSEDDNKPSDSIEMENENENDPIWLATEAVKSCIKGSRSVYATLTNYCLQGMRSTETVSNEVFMPLSESRSILDRVLRAFHGAEIWLSDQAGQRVVITQQHDLLQLYLSQNPLMKAALESQ